MKKLVRILVFVTCAGTISGCSPLSPAAQQYVSPAAKQYVQRSDTVTLSAGNDQAVNAINSMIDPWPPGVSDRRIPANGERMVGAIVRYRTPATAQRSGGQSGQATPPASTSPSPPSASEATLPY